MLFTSDLRYDLIGILISLFVIFIAYAKWTYTYWKRRGVEGPEPIVPFGNLKSVCLGKIPFGQYYTETYLKLKTKGLRHGGVYFGLIPQYVPVDIEIVKHILQNDFQHFLGRGFFVNEKLDPISLNVFSLDGPKWKAMRAKYTPTFTSGKMKMMFDTVIECTNALNTFLSENWKNGPIDMRDISRRFTIDVIGSCAFGVEINSIKDPSSEFYKQGCKLSNVDIFTAISQFANFFMPHWLLYLMKVRISTKDAEKFFCRLVNETIQYRRENNVARNDFLNLLIQMKNNESSAVKEKLGSNVAIGKKEDALSLNEIVAQCFLFFAAGFDTSSSTIAHAAYEVGIQPVIQEKLRDEINTVLQKHNNKITYESVMEMPYLEKVIDETLRKYPALQQLTRICNKEYKVPDSDVIIEKGTYVIIPLRGIHYDPEYYPEPEKFDPERFNEENKAERSPFSYIPFGEGPRVCLGLRFGMMLVKVGLVSLLRNFKLTLSKKTAVPLELSKRGLFVSTKGGIWIDIQKIT